MKLCSKIMLLTAFVLCILLTPTIALQNTSPLHNAYHSLESSSRHDEIPIPKGLQHLGHHIHVHHFKANQQQGQTCGNHATFNALALQELVDEGNALTSHHVQERARLYFHNMKDSEYKLNFEDICEFGQSLGLGNTHVVAFNPDIHQFYSAAAFNANQDYTGFIQDLRTSKNMLAQFILNYSDHWVTISVIKHHAHSRIIYHNSTNAPLTKESTPYHFIQELCGKLM